MKKIIIISILFFSATVFFATAGHASAYGECSEYGMFVYYDMLTDSCKCMSGYVFDRNLLGNLSCVSGNTFCHDHYGYGSEWDYLGQGCRCSSGYVWDTDYFGNRTCVSGDTYCSDRYGYGSEYNSVAKSCKCSSGYEFTEKLGGGLECVSCFMKYGLHSSYNYLLDKCECNDGYTLSDEGTCVEKQNNVYFIMKEVNTDDRKAVIKSEYDYKYYLVRYGLGCLSTTIRRYVGNRIVVNLGTDFDVDVGDMIVLFDDDETCNILSREKVASDFTLEEAEPTFTPTCPDLINGYLGSDGKCYCNSGYEWNSSINSCTKSAIKPDISFSTKLSGMILLQVESAGEAWYVYPGDFKRYYLGRPSDAFNVMRKLGLGANHSFITDTAIFPSYVLGKILLDVESHGEAYYIYPKDRKKYYLGRPEDAFKIMREKGLGIANSDLNKILINILP